MLSIKSDVNKPWSNWSGSVECTPKQILYPKSIEEVITIVQRAKHSGKYVRVVGSGHSFPPLNYTDQLMVSLDLLEGIVNLNEAEKTVTVYAGTKLKKLGEALEELGYAQENLGDINAQSIAGAISTGTHGTGIRFGNLSTQVVALWLVTPEGKLFECSETKNEDFFKAAQVSLGLLGIIVKVKLQVVPLYRLHQRTFHMNLDECIAQAETLRDQNRNFEFFWFPYTKSVQVKLLNETDLPPSESRAWNDWKTNVLENYAFGFLSMLCRLFPSLCKSISRLSASSIPNTDVVDVSHRIYATPRLVRFQEMEYFVPIEHFETVMREMEQKIEEGQYAVHFPIEVRFVKADDIWLSPAYERDCAVFAVHMYKGMPYEEYFKAMEEIFLRYDGRPHWGKHHHLTKEQMLKLYPKWKDFLKLRKLFDPYDIFLNPYLRKLFNENESETIDKDQQRTYSTDQIVQSVRTMSMEQS